MPYKPDQREYRSFAGNFHAVAETEDRRSAYTVEGYATTFDVPYDFRRAKECIRSTAMAGADMSDVIFQLNHCGQTLARLKNGTLELTVDEHGLFVRADLSGSQAGRDLYEAISNGLIDKMSWGFNVAPDGWEWDEKTRTSYITKVEKVFDVSAVSIPADQDTDIHARSYLDGVIEQEHQELVRRENERRQRQAAALKLRLL
jgi:HK97 family phage prohead protease